MILVVFLLNYRFNDKVHSFCYNFISVEGGVNLNFKQFGRMYNERNDVSDTGT